MSVVTLFVESQNASSERRFQKSLTIDALKTRLEPIVGITAADQRLTVWQGTMPVCSIDGDLTKMLGFYPVEDYMTLKVENASPTSALGMQLNFNDDSQVEKMVMADDEYDRRQDSVRAFKRRHNLGRFADNKSAMSIDEEDEFKEQAEGIQAGQRCEVNLTGGEYRKRGTVRFVGKTGFRPGYWVGVEYDEPVGKNDGSVDGQVYFMCAMGHGAFVRPDRVAVGDFPEEDLFESDLEEM
ncbi:hypothetical protein GQ54DRAFT_64852 [Martensiomyces pterosporus]|nr:hypothetical protein GQ54DRAFT_64852 [Martensiomyces pterosporus]